MPTFLVGDRINWLSYTDVATLQMSHTSHWAIVNATRSVTQLQQADEGTYYFNRRKFRNANSGILDFSAKVYLAKFLKTTIRESLSHKYFSTFRLLLVLTEIVKEASFSADSLFFCIFLCILNVIPKNKSRNFRLLYLNTVLKIPGSSFLLI